MSRPEKSELFRMRKIVERRNDRLEGGERWRMLDMVLTLVSVVVFVIAIRGAVVEPVRVDGDSMLDTLFDGDYMFVEKLTYAVSEPKAGDIVICYYPDSYYEARNKGYYTRVKRVVAVAGDTVQIKDGVVYVNGKLLDEPYLSPDRSVTDGADTPVTIGEGEVYVLGDNRPNSNDSRNALVGPISREKIVGKTHFVLFPFSRIRRIEKWN